MEKETNATALAILLLAKMVAKSGKVKLTKAERFAFSQIAHTAGNNIPAFSDLINGVE